MLCSRWQGEHKAKFKRGCDSASLKLTVARLPECCGHSSSRYSKNCKFGEAVTVNKLKSLGLHQSRGLHHSESLKFGAATLIWWFLLITTLMMSSPKEDAPIQQAEKVISEQQESVVAPPTEGHVEEGGDQANLSNTEEDGEAKNKDPNTQKGDGASLKIEETEEENQDENKEKPHCKK